MRSIAVFLGRVALSLVFIFAAIHKILNWNDSLQFLQTALVDWQGRLSGLDVVYNFFDFLVAAVSFLLMAAVICEGVGGLLVLLGLQVRLGAVLLLLVLIPATLLFHAFWEIKSPAEQNLQMIMFLKNLSIFGGLLILLAYGRGASAAKESN